MTQLIKLIKYSRFLSRIAIIFSIFYSLIYEFVSFSSESETSFIRSPEQVS